ncbi:MAG: SET domain-containing protein-lysine N-methyltransferase [Planctomycetes bacterium]|nr:SET domain-containing protein-lysine N-methyltransferase [Planctomycetota bacterium]
MAQTDATFEVVIGHSPVHGRGAYVRGFVPAGTPVITCGGIETHREALDPDARALQVGPDTFLVENVDKPTADDYMNHCCEPNVGFVNGSLTLIALRDIHDGEELFFDYSTTINEPGWTIPCTCGAANCRGVIKSFRDLEPAQRRRLRGIALSYLRDAHHD